MRYDGGIKVGGLGKPIMPWQWPSGEKIAATIEEMKASARESDETRELLTGLGFDIQQLASWSPDDPEAAGIEIDVVDALLARDGYGLDAPGVLQHPRLGSGLQLAQRRSLVRPGHRPAVHQID